MSGLDAGLIAIVLVSLSVGLWRGLLYEVLSLLGWPIAFVLSKLFAGSVAPLLPIAQEVWRITAAYALLFIVALIAWSILARLTSRLLKSAGVAWTDRLMGGLFGVLRGALVVLVLAWLAGMTQIPEQPYWRGALTSKTLEDIALLTKAWLPDGIAQRVHYRTRS
jgi:membrane protein required for colicin V production